MWDFYDNNAAAYHRQTFPMDPASFLTPFCRRLPPGGKILDVGCGSGRDLVWLKARGYRVMGLDRAFKLAAVAAREAECPVIVGDFETFDFTPFAVDGLLLVGALVHVEAERLEKVLRRILTALKPGGHVLLTLKEGCGTRTSPDGRVFHLWNHNALADRFAPCGLDLLDFFRQPSSLGNNDVWLTYVLKGELTRHDQLKALYLEIKEDLDGASPSLPDFIGNSHQVDPYLFIRHFGGWLRTRLYSLLDLSDTRWQIRDIALGFLGK